MMEALNFKDDLKFEIIYLFEIPFFESDRNFRDVNIITAETEYAKFKIKIRRHAGLAGSMTVSHANGPRFNPWPPPNVCYQCHPKR